MAGEQTIYLDAYRQRLEALVAVDDTAWQALCSVLKVKAVAAGSHLLVPGRVCRHVYFVHSGMFRMYRAQGEEEVTTAFYAEQQFMADMKSIATLQPSHYYLQAVEDAVVVMIEKSEMTALYTQLPQMEKIGKAILEHMLIETNEWKEMYTLYAPGDRYKLLIDKAPYILHRAMLRHVASFLGVRPETLSRIRKRMSDNFKKD